MDMNGYCRTTSFSRWKLCHMERKLYKTIEYLRLHSTDFDPDFTTMIALAISYLVTDNLELQKDSQRQISLIVIRNKKILMDSNSPTPAPMTIVFVSKNFSPLSTFSRQSGKQKVSRVSETIQQFQICFADIFSFCRVTGLPHNLHVLHIIISDFLYMSPIVICALSVTVYETFTVKICTTLTLTFRMGQGHM